MFVDNVIPALHEFVEDGRRTALVTLLDVVGSSPRPRGSQVGVADDGRFVGMITGGCAEKAIVAEALLCLERGENSVVRYGDGSPYLDVVLPCGSGIDIYIETRDSAQIISKSYIRQQNREPVWMAIDRQALSSRVLESPDRASESEFVHRYDPDYRLLVFGEGSNLIAFCTVAGASGLAVVAYSPDRESIDRLAQQGIEGHHIRAQDQIDVLAIDKCTAVVTLLHAHDWERTILHAALNSDADYIGALGSRATHAARLQTLAQMPTTKRSADCIRAPIGLDIGARNPAEIAVSILGEIIAHRRRKTL